MDFWERTQMCCAGSQSYSLKCLCTAHKEKSHVNKRKVLFTLGVYFVYVYAGVEVSVRSKNANISETDKCLYKEFNI